LPALKKPGRTGVGSEKPFLSETDALKKFPGDCTRDQGYILRKEEAMRIHFLYVMMLLSLASPLWADYKDALKAGDYDTAIREIRPLALEGDAEAQSILGTMYANGQGVPVNNEKAAEWTRKAAEKGFANAQYNLGIMYDTGTGVRQSYTEAAKWYRKAAEQEVTEAQYNLGLMYEEGQGVKKDIVQAYAWVMLAAAADDQRAIRKKEEMAGKLTPSQKKKADKLADKWKSGEK
jgi:TPR repeat protein